MTGPQNFSAMGDLLKKVMENPELLSGAMSMASALASSGALNGLFQKKEDSPPSGAASTAGPSAGGSQTGGSPMGTGGLSGLAGLLGALGSQGSAPQGGQGSPGAARPGAGTETGSGQTGQQGQQGQTGQTGVSGPPAAPRRAGHKERIALLEAMRPFISPEKKDRLELLIRLLGVMEVAEGMGLWK